MCFSVWFDFFFCLLLRQPVSFTLDTGPHFAQFDQFMCVCCLSLSLFHTHSDFVVCFEFAFWPFVSNRVTIHDLTCYRWIMFKQKHKVNYVSLSLSLFSCHTQILASFSVLYLYKFRIYYNYYVFVHTSTHLYCVFVSLLLLSLFFYSFCANVWERTGSFDFPIHMYCILYNSDERFNSTIVLLTYTQWQTCTKSSSWYHTILISI